MCFYWNVNKHQKYKEHQFGECHPLSRSVTSNISYSLRSGPFLKIMYSLKILSKNMCEMYVLQLVLGCYKKSFQYFQYLIFNFQTDNDKFSLEASHRCLFDLKVSSIHRTWLSLNLQKTWTWSGLCWLSAFFSAPLWPVQCPVHQTPLRYALTPFPSICKNC